MYPTPYSIYLRGGHRVRLPEATFTPSCCRNACCRGFSSLSDASLAPKKTFGVESLGATWRCSEIGGGGLNAQLTSPQTTLRTSLLGASFPVSMIPTASHMPCLHNHICLGRTSRCYTGRVSASYKGYTRVIWGLHSGYMRVIKGCKGVVSRIMFT